MAVSPPPFSVDGNSAACKRYQSGEPVSFGCATAIPGWNNCIRFDRGAGQVRNVRPLVNRYYNPAAFVDSNANRNGGAYRFGNYPRGNGDARMKSYFNEDFSIIRNIRVVEAVSLQFKAELLNAFNRHVFATPDI
jgi:hypothetical protein